MEIGETMVYIVLLLVVFLVWVYYQKSESQRWRQHNEGENSKWQDMIRVHTAHMEKILIFQNEERKKDYDLLRDMMETIEYQTAALIRVEQKLDAGTRK